MNFGEGGLAGVTAMPFPRRVISLKPPIGQRRCPSCGLPMFLSEIDATEKDHEDLHTFECQECAYAETAIVQLQ